MLYFVPHETQAVSSETLSEIGLRRSFPGGFSAAGVSRESPAGSGIPGVVIADPKYMRPSDLGYFPNKQQWTKIQAVTHKGDAIWVGYPTDGRPRPRDFCRERMMGGHWVDLGDGHRWLIPAIRALEETGKTEDDPIGTLRTIIPSEILQFGMNKDGVWVPGQIIDRYQSLWEAANIFWDVVHEQADPDVVASFTYPRMISVVLAALEINYSIAPYDAQALGLITGEVVIDAMQAIVDLPKVMELAKKRAAADGETPSNGPAA
jgi:hypothetical protein